MQLPTRRLYLVSREVGCVSLRKSKIRFLNPRGRKSEDGFYVSLLDRSIQDLSDRGASNERKNPLPECKDSSVSSTNHDPKDLFSKETQNPFSDSFGFKNPILDFLKETHPKRCDPPNIKIDIMLYSMVSVLPLSECSHRKRHALIWHLSKLYLVTLTVY